MKLFFSGNVFTFGDGSVPEQTLEREKTCCVMLSYWEMNKEGRRNTTEERFYRHLARRKKQK